MNDKIKLALEQKISPTELKAGRLIMQVIGNKPNIQFLIGGRIAANYDKM